MAACNCTCFSSHNQMSLCRILKWTSLNRFQMLATRCQWEAGPKSDLWGSPTMWPIPGCIWCYLRTSCEQTDACENITFPPLRLQAVTICLDPCVCLGQVWTFLHAILKAIPVWNVPLGIQFHIIQFKVYGSSLREHSATMSDFLQ